MRSTCGHVSEGARSVSAPTARGPGIARRVPLGCARGRRRPAALKRVVLAAFLVCAWAASARAAPARGPLRVHPSNPRYFTDGTGRAVLLTGSHTWPNLVDMGPSDPPPRFDFDGYLDFLRKHGHNFIRLWTWEHTTWDTRGNREDRLHHAGPQPYARTGPGQALDGKPRFDLSKYDAEYFRRLRSRVEEAGRGGIYVSVMLFEGWAMQRSPGAWESHPFHPKNNVNGIDGDAVTVNLSAAEGALAVEWLDPKTGKARAGEAAEGGAPRTFTPPFAGDAVLYLAQPKPAD